MLIQDEVGMNEYPGIEEQLKSFELSLNTMTQSGFFDQDVLGQIEALCEGLLDTCSDTSTEDTQLIDRASLCPSLFLESETQEQIKVTFFGNFEISFKGKSVDLSSHNRAKQILKFLLLHRGERIPKEVLMDVFWMELDTQKARNNLNVNLHYLRKGLSDAGIDPGLIGTESGCYYIEKGEYLWMDTEQFKDHRHVVSATRNEDRIFLLEKSMTYYSDSFLLEDQYEEWAAKQRQEMRAAYDVLLRMLRAEYLRAERYEAVIELSDIALSKDPLDEVSLKHLMWCYQTLGLRHKAVRQYRLYTKKLSEELGIIPSQGLRVAFMDMRAGRKWDLI